MTAYALGDAAPPRVRAPLLRRPGLLRWHALLVYPRRETAAKAWLEQRGVYAFFPVAVVRLAYRHRYREITRAYLPGYLFAKFPGEPAWHEVIGSPFIHNTLRRHNGEPGILHPETMESLKAMRTTDDMLAERRQAATTIRRGCKVRFVRGPFEGWEVEVVDAPTEDGFSFRIAMLGGAVPGTASIGDVEFVSAAE